MNQQETNFNETTVRKNFFVHPMRGLAVGPSQTGKTEWIYSFLQSLFSRKKISFIQFVIL